MSHVYLISLKKVAMAESVGVELALSIHDLYPMYLMESSHICWERNFN